MPNTTYGTPYVASSDLVSAYPGVSSTLATRVDDISLKGNGLNDQTGTTYTLVLTDGGKTITLNNASAVTVTIPTNTSVAFPLGTEINFVNKGAGTVTIQPTGGVTLNGGNLTLPQFAAVQVVKLDTNTWGQLDSVASSPGLVLVSPTSIANSGGSASASGGAVTFSGVTSLSLNGCFTASYEWYRILADFTITSGGADMLFRLRVSGSDNTASSYTRQRLQGNGTVVTASSDSTTSWIVSSADGGRSVFSMDIFGPQLTRTTGFRSHGGRGDFSAVYVGNHTTATSFDGFTLYPSGSSYNGTIRVYGYRN